MAIAVSRGVVRGDGVLQRAGGTDRLAVARSGAMYASDEE
jgi:hypothetical protein